MSFGPETISQYLSSFGGGATTNIMQYIQYFIISAGLIAGMYFFLYMSKFKIKATVYPLYGSGKDGSFSVGSPKKARLKWNKHRTAWIKMFGRKEIEPFDSEYIYPGNKIIAFEINEEWIPGRININQTEDKIRAEINPIPYAIKNWQATQIDKYAQEFARHDFWSENKTLIAIMVTAVVVGIVLCVVAYYTYQHIDKMIPVLKTLGENVQSNYVIPSGGAPL